MMVQAFEKYGGDLSIPLLRKIHNLVTAGITRHQPLGASRVQRAQMESAEHKRCAGRIVSLANLRGRF